MLQRNRTVCCNECFKTDGLLHFRWASALEGWFGASPMRHPSSRRARCYPRTRRRQHNPSTTLHTAALNSCKSICHEIKRMVCCSEKRMVCCSEKRMVCCTVLGRFAASPMRLPSSRRARCYPRARRRQHGPIPTLHTAASYNLNL